MTTSIALQSGSRKRPANDTFDPEALMVKSLSKTNRWIIVPIASIAILAVLLGLLGALKRKIEAQTQGQISAKDVFDQTTRLTNLSLLPVSATQTANKQTIYTSQGVVKRVWNVDCFDGNGEQVGYARWDADSGELSVLSRLASASRVAAPDLTQAQAISRTWLLLRQPGIRIPAGRWRLVDSPETSGDCWHVTAISNLTRALITINKRTGQVTYAHFPVKERSATPSSVKFSQ